MQSEIIPAENKLVVIFISGLLLLSTLVSAAGIYSGTGDDGEIILVEIKSSSQIEELRDLNVNILER
ncbi:MAG: hypothetical protein KGY76_08385, partial [Candidatus Thermoplasmatota archaeon]|nr:hypothetical protein [Candidatus Thermoplasmatota archaeon]